MTDEPLKFVYMGIKKKFFIIFIYLFTSVYLSLFISSTLFLILIFFFFSILLHFECILMKDDR